VALFLYKSVLPELISDWYNSPEYSHGFLVPLISAYVIWKRRAKLKQLERQPSMVAGFSLALFALFLLVVGSLGAELFLTRISIVVLIMASILYFWGMRLLKELAFPVSFLLLAIPLPAIIYNQIVFPLQLLASQLATGILDITRAMPILREGNVLILPNTTLEVVEACSGIRSLMSLLTLSIAYGYLIEKDILVRWLLVLSMIPVAIAANSARVMATALMAYYVSPSASEGLTHEASGIVIFVIATLMMVGLHKLFSIARVRLSRSRHEA
jgi:exosortase